jgi:hypothetical protein
LSAIFRDIEFAAPQNADCALSSAKHTLSLSLSHSRAPCSRRRLVFKRGALFSGEISVKLSCPENIECNIPLSHLLERRPGFELVKLEALSLRRLLEKCSRAHPACTYPFIPRHSLAVYVCSVQAGADAATAAQVSSQRLFGS